MIILDRYFYGLGLGILILASLAIDLVRALDFRSKREWTLLSLYIALVSFTLVLWIYALVND